MTGNMARVLALLAIGGLLGTGLSCGDDDASSPTPDPDLRFFLTCGDPVCSGHRPDPAIPACIDQVEGASCADEGALCDPVRFCNERIVCATSDPQAGPGGCPISRRETKRDVRYLDRSQVEELHRDLLRVPLARYRYRAEGPGARERLGFVIEDVEPSPGVDSERDRVDLYGLATMAVAGLQAQAREIARLEAEIRDLRARLDALETPAPGSSPEEDAPPPVD